MGLGKHWTKSEMCALLQGAGVYGLAWFRRKCGTSYPEGDWPGADQGRSDASIRHKAYRMYGTGGLTRGSYTLAQACKRTGYTRTQFERAREALAQKWKRTSPTGPFLIYEEQLDEMTCWLQVDYWSKKHRLYNCIRCGTDTRPHQSQGLCDRCFGRYAHRLIRAGFPVGCEALALCVREHLEDAAEAIEQLSRGRAVPDEVLVRLTRR